MSVEFSTVVAAAVTFCAAEVGDGEGDDREGAGASGALLGAILSVTRSGDGAGAGIVAAVDDRG